MSQEATKHCATDSAQAFRALMEGRRAIRRLTSEPVPEQVIQECLETAVLAPSSCNLQPWSFHVVRSPELLLQLQTVCLNQNAAKAPLIIAVLARPDTWKAACTNVLKYWPEKDVPRSIASFYMSIAPFQYNQGFLGALGLFKRLLIGWTGIKRPVMRGPNSLAEMQLWAVKSSSLAAQSLMLAFQSHGYGTCPMEGFDEKRLRKVLPIPKEAIPIMLLAVGVPGERAVYNPRLRFPIGQCVTWH
ncbi:nitroreductase [Pseudomonas aeruginosa]|jgi:nitroreductase|uniref:nitroreductase family protein n=1 Tax=Pseudomonas aeruginosa TaxID=287 RepID=UPI0007079F84|nr:nitroreductase family protein [Pseudomonas aeruginosa]KQJ58443.1 nitroreductase [Pseudomonas aeruginosa]MBI8718039.1 nitroreductase family protein [Pseudomonas aeruginosa]MCO3533363.1 nitroreductase family protein [Pseudomonas aeruginosa]NPY12548.1 nitroreductase family protein [Pseudomonas aeruginosa]UHU63951.1 nitroreductase family protein [Pseudomonas aeruginosa]